MCPKIYSSVISKKCELTLSFLSRISSYNEVPHVNIPYLMPLRMIIWLWLDICVGHLGDNGYASASVFVFGRTDIFICYCTSLCVSISTVHTFLFICKYLCVFLSMQSKVCDCNRWMCTGGRLKDIQSRISRHVWCRVGCGVEMLANDRNSCTSTCKACCTQMCLSHNINII